MYAHKSAAMAGSWHPVRSPSLLYQRPFAHTMPARISAQSPHPAEVRGTALDFDGPQDDEMGGEEPSSGELPGIEITRAPGTPGEEEFGGGAIPLDKPAETPAKCPTKTVVEKTTDMTPDGIKKGYRTGYGAVATMKVEPDTTNWDSTQIVESLKLTKSTCPEEFGINPCSGSSTFTVGAESNSSVLGKLAATKNRFYDFHTTRWNKGSLLHDRNPKNIDSCEAVCEQNYSCGGKVIGTHKITRTFTKGKSGDRDVTLVNVKKT